MFSRTLFTLLFLLSQLACLAQDDSELAKRNGFKDIILGMPVDSVVGSKFKKDILEKNEFPAALYEVDNPNYKNIGEVKVKKLELKSYKGLVYQIDVITHKDTRLMKGMERLYGKPKYILPTDSYNWTADSLSLTFKDHSKREIKLTYRSYPVLMQMRIDKGKKIDDIADDF
ncbi:MAG TPA: hypothetical protein PK185_09910 [Cyclobacteriaceae bacterium]|nr:hypothetical protein [Cyclobacteriaceae bacterium]